jgi:WD40 repeat protein
VSFLTGKVNNALVYTPCGKYIVYPLGSFIVLKNMVTEKEAFFDGHTSEVSCVSVSPDGNRLASGQVNLMGVKVKRINCL